MSLLVKMISLIVFAGSTAQHPTPAPMNSPPASEEVGEFLVVPLKYTTAYDIGFTLEDLLKPRNGPGPRFNEGPDEKTLIITDFRPAQKETIMKMIALFDVKQADDGEAGKSRDGKSGSGRSSNSPEVRIFPLQYTTPHAAIESIFPIFKNVKLSADVSTNSLIVSASSGDIAAIEKLLTHIDKAEKASGATIAGVRTIQLKHRATDDVTKKLMSLISPGQPDSRVASDEGRGKIILRGSHDFLDLAQQVIGELDVPAQMIRFEFAFFTADQNAGATGESDEAGKIPADLSPVVGELERFGRVRLLGRLACNSMEDHQFMVEGALGDGLSAKVSGSIINAVTDGSIQLNVKGSVRLTRFTGDPKSPPQSSAFEINTTVVTRRGDTVMIGSAPAGWEPGESAIMVLQAKQ